MNEQATFFFRAQTIGRGGDVRLRAALRHNLRETSTGNVDVTRSHHNIILSGASCATSVFDEVVRNRPGLGITPTRVNSTIAAEVLFSLPNETQIVVRSYFEDCLWWIHRTFGTDAVFSAVIHLDEATPHMHVLMHPIRGGKWLRSRVFGNREALAELSDRFFSDVASKHGLRRPPSATLSADGKRHLAKAVLQQLEASQDPALHSALWLHIRTSIHADPIRWGASIGCTALPTSSCEQGI